MSFGLFITVGPSLSPAAEGGGCVVVVDLEDDGAKERGLITIEVLPEAPRAGLAAVMHVLARFVESEQFRSIDFDKGEMPVEAEENGTRRLIRANGGCLRADGTVERDCEPS